MSVIFDKNTVVEGEWITVGLKMVCPQNSRFCLLHNESGEEAHEN